MTNDRKTVAWFLLIAFGISWPLFLLPIAFGRPGSPARQVASMAAWSAAMWGPGLAAIIVTRRVARRSLGTLNLGRLGPKWPYLWAWLLPPALAILSGMLTLAMGAGRLDLEFTAVREAMAQVRFGKGLPPAILVGTQVIFCFTVAPVLNCIFALGEELGWRRFLLERLLPLGKWRAILLSSGIWGVWHAPAVVQGLNYPGWPVLGVFMMIVFCLLLGTIFSWLYLQTRSPWTPALAHASLNATVGLPMFFLKDVDIVIGGTVASVIGWIGLASVVGWLVLSRRVPVTSKKETAAVVPDYAREKQESRGGDSNP
jgi:membrane protease YdiL (CAAX protease family)